MDSALTGFSDEDLIGILESFGIKESMSRDEMIHTIIELQDTSEITSAQETNFNLKEGDNVVVGNLGSLKEENQTSSDTEVQESVQITDETAKAPMISKSTNNATEQSELSDEQAELVAGFMGVVGVEEQQAKGYLEASFWDLERAVSLFLETERGNSSDKNIMNSTLDTNVNINIRPKDDSDDDTQEHELDEMQRMMRDLMQRHLGRQISFDEPPSPLKKQDSYDEEGYRKPDAIKTQRLLSGRDLQYREADYAHLAIEPHIDWFFPLPGYNSLEPFELARQRGAREALWILVNIQNHTIWDSQALNRDLWGDEAVREFIAAGNYIFWQRNFSSVAGREYMNTYNLHEDNLPQIQIIDPHTGAKLFSWTGPITPEELISKLLEFSEKHKLQPIKAQKQEDPSADPSTKKNVEVAANENTFVTPVRPPQPPSEEIAVQKQPIVEEDYSLPAEPDEHHVDVVKISIKMMNGKAITRRYLKTDSVQVLFHTVKALDKESRSRAFELYTRFPALQLSSLLDKTLEEAKLANCLVLQRWM